ncbi:MAG TPA: hypothetical protein DDX59_06630 [Lachnospiraceae bacterium]|nr:hypothetical protein [Lachnospiraceae bacterium]
MAERRMFTKKVTDDDKFAALSSSAQALYLHLSMSADDDGFSNQVAISMFRAHASLQDLEALLKNRYIYQFETGVVVIKHWRMANALRKDRYTETQFQAELARLRIGETGAYEWLPDGCQMVAERLPDGCQVVATGKDRLGKDRLDKDREGDALKSAPPAPQKHQTSKYQSILNDYNSTCTKLPRAIRLSDARRKAIAARLKVYSAEDIHEAFAKAQASPFLTGQNKRDWTATFDWLMKDANMAKVLDGNYDDQRQSAQTGELADWEKEWLEEYRYMQGEKTGDKNKGCDDA